jgi:hypothetical protein
MERGNAQGERPALSISTNGFHSKITKAAKTGYLDGKMFYAAIPLFVLSA